MGEVGKIWGPVSPPNYFFPKGPGSFFGGNFPQHFPYNQFFLNRGINFLGKFLGKLGEEKIPGALHFYILNWGKEVVAPGKGG